MGGQPIVERRHVFLLILAVLVTLGLRSCGRTAAAPQASESGWSAHRWRVSRRHEPALKRPRLAKLMLMGRPAEGRSAAGGTVPAGSKGAIPHPPSEATIAETA